MFYTEAQREAALDLLQSIAPDADAQQAQEFVRAFIHNPDGFRNIPEFRYNASDAYREAN